MWRELQRLKGDPSVPLAMITINFFEALIIASIFYNLPNNTGSFFKRGAIVFMIVSYTNVSFRTLTDFIRYC